MSTSMDFAVIEETTRLSFEDRMPFPEVVEKLIGIGVERYHTDLSRLEKTFYNFSGATARETIPLHDPPVMGGEFSEGGVVAALQSIQNGQIDYPEFLRRIMEAGTVSYDVFFGGKKVIYTGRNGEFYVENFPGSK